MPLDLAGFKKVFLCVHTVHLTFIKHRKIGHNKIAVQQVLCLCCSG